MIKRTGVREAKAHLSRLLRSVQRGDEWIITDRGRPVARLGPATDTALPLGERIRRLEEAGLIEPPGRLHQKVMPRPVKRKVAQRWLQDDRNA